MALVVLPSCLPCLEQRVLALQVPPPHRTLLISATWGHTAPLQEWVLLTDPSEQGTAENTMLRATQSNIRFISKENK